jgi:hypothetical protein
VTAASVEEMVISTSGISADINADGVVVNIIPKEGGNRFNTTIAGLFSNNSMESDNLDDNLRQRGLTTATKTQQLFDESVAVGGPIKKDKIWFLGTLRSWGFARQYAGTHWNETQDQFPTPPDADGQSGEMDTVGRIGSGSGSISTRTTC